jgi:hypothetical protein
MLCYVGFLAFLPPLLPFLLSVWFPLHGECVLLFVIIVSPASQQLIEQRLGKFRDGNLLLFCSWLTRILSARKPFLAHQGDVIVPPLLLTSANSLFLSSVALALWEDVAM